MMIMNVEQVTRIRKATFVSQAPCIFFRHWIDCKRDIKAMIDVRNAVGIHNESEYLSYASQKEYYAVGTTGTNGELLAVVGSGAAGYTPNAKFVKVLSGYRYVYYMSKSMNTAWVDLPSGQYDDAQQAMLTAVSTNGDAQLVYTTDGSNPTASSKKVASGTKITIDGDVTLKVGLLIGTTVSGIVTRTYTKASVADKRIINIYVNTDNVGWTAVNFWTWGGDDSHAPANRSWTGDKVTTTTSISGKNWFSKQYTINGDDDFVNFVFSTGGGSPQTVDINNISTDKFFEISTQKEGSKYLVNDVSDQYTAIRPVFATENVSSAIYTLDGRRVTTPKRGIYIRGGKKFVIK